MTTKAPAKERVLVLIDPVSCGTAALERALQELDPERHVPTLAVVAKAPAGTTAGDTNVSPEFAYADSALAIYRRAAEEAGFIAEAWAAPERREQLTREIEATGPYGRALAVSPSGTWRRLVKQDITRLLESVGLETSLHCSR